MYRGNCEWGIQATGMNDRKQLGGEAACCVLRVLVTFEPAPSLSVLSPAHRDSTCDHTRSEHTRLLRFLVHRKRREPDRSHLQGPHRGFLCVPLTGWHPRVQMLRVDRPAAPSLDSGGPSVTTCVPLNFSIQLIAPQIRTQPGRGAQPPPRASAQGAAPRPQTSAGDKDPPRFLGSDVRGAVGVGLQRRWGGGSACFHSRSPIFPHKQARCTHKGAPLLHRAASSTHRVPLLHHRAGPSSLLRSRAVAASPAPAARAATQQAARWPLVLLYYAATSVWGMPGTVVFGLRRADVYFLPCSAVPGRGRDQRLCAAKEGQILRPLMVVEAVAFS